ncbi:cell wall metabolism sensor histidine kinase WalK [Nocardioides sp.]|uniref:sensor histidine kinase n=1 Tax=Nocardioides sp. TaxID=35761 RepID=UPI0026337042|nr:PAS domain-containing sensor histidine kinase [Nocardioides sp.]
MRSYLAALRRVVNLVDDPDPRLLQTAFAALVLLDTLLRSSVGTPLDAARGPLVGLGLLALTTLAVWVAPGAGSGVRHAPLLVVGLDLAAVGLVRLVPEGSAAGILVVLPALWLARLHGARGAAAAGLAAAAVVSVPGLLYVGLSGASLTRAVLPPLVAWLVGLGVASAVTRAESERRISTAILDTVDVGLVLLDAEGRYLRANRRHQDFIDLAFPDGHAGRAGQLGAVHHPDGRRVAREEMPSFRAASGEEYSDIRIWCGDDPLTRRALSVSARTLRDDQGRRVGAALAYKDITDLLSALEAKDEFVSTVSHELRTPLASIAGYVEVVLGREDLPAPAADHLRVVERNTVRLDRLVGDLLATAQAGSGPLPVHRTESDLAVLVREAVEVATPAAEAAGVELDRRCPGSLPVHVDPRRIGQVLDNLLSNALKHTGAGGRVCVEVTERPAESQGGQGGLVELAVCDTGTGIPPDDLDRLFVRFHRSSTSRDLAIPGLGLGLCIARDIVAAHGGRIDVESEVGVGTTVRVLLPRQAPAGP